MKETFSVLMLVTFLVGSVGLIRGQAGAGSAQRKITDAERTFLSAAGSYLKAVNSVGQDLAKKMAGASNGSSTLTEIRTSVAAAQQIENAGYTGDYKKRVGVGAPSSMMAISKNIDEIHRLFQAAMREYLEYWKDQNTAHITSGQDTFAKSITLTNSTIALGNKTMGGLTR